MIAGNLSDLAKSVTDSLIPKWLHEYLSEHRNEMIFDLKVFGKHVIKGPNCEITITDRKRAS